MTDSQTQNQIQSVREGKISREGGQPIGVCIYVSARELRSMEIDLDGKETIQYQVEAASIEIIERESTTR